MRFVIRDAWVARRHAAINTTEVKSTQRQGRGQGGYVCGAFINAESKEVYRAVCTEIQCMSLHTNRN